MDSDKTTPSTPNKSNEPTDAQAPVTGGDVTGGTPPTSPSEDSSNPTVAFGGGSTPDASAPGSDANGPASDAGAPGASTETPETLGLASEEPAAKDGLASADAGSTPPTPDSSAPAGDSTPSPQPSFSASDVPPTAPAGAPHGKNLMTIVVVVVALVIVAAAAFLLMG